MRYYRIHNSGGSVGLPACLPQTFGKKSSIWLLRLEGTVEQLVTASGDHWYVYVLSGGVLGVLEHGGMGFGQDVENVSSKRSIKKAFNNVVGLE